MDIIIFNKHLALVNYGFTIHNLSHITDNLLIIANYIINKVDDFKNIYLKYKEENKYQIIKDRNNCLHLPSYKFTVINQTETYVTTLEDIINNIQLIVDSSNDYIVIYYNIDIFLEALGYNLNDEIDYTNGTKSYPTYEQ